MSNDFRKWLEVVNEADISPAEAKHALNKAAEMHNAKSWFGSSEVKYEDLLAAWKKLGSPSDTKEIYKMLAKSGIDEYYIKQALKQMGVSKKTGSDMRVSALANAIKKLNIHSYIIDYLADFHGIKESVLFEKTLSDADIKGVFAKLAASPADASSDVKSYIKNWITELNSGDTSTQLELVKEIAKYAYDRQGSPEHAAMVPVILSAIHKTELPDYIKRTILSMIKGGKFSQPSIDDLALDREVPDANAPFKDRATAPAKKPSYKPNFRSRSSSPPAKPRQVEATNMNDLQSFFESVIIQSTYGRSKR